MSVLQYGKVEEKKPLFLPSFLGEDILISTGMKLPNVHGEGYPSATFFSLFLSFCSELVHRISGYPLCSTHEHCTPQMRILL